MKRKKVEKILSGLSEKIEKVTDLVAKDVIHITLNLIECLLEEHESQVKEIQTLKNEINLLKGEQGQPDINKESTNDGKNNNHSSEDERKKRRPRKPRKPGGTKKSKVTVDRIIDMPLDQSTLPKGTARHGITSTVVQDIHFGTDNIEFRRETYYNKETKQWFTAPLPDGYDAEYGPKIKAYVKTAYSIWGMTISAIVSALTCMNIKISDATVSRMLLKDSEPLHQEKGDIFKAGLRATPYQHLDDTSGREKGKNRYVHILANSYYTAYFTEKKKNRLTIIEVLSGGELAFLLNQKALYLMEEMGLPKKYLSQIAEKGPMDILTHQEMESLKTELFPDPDKHEKNRTIVVEACAISAYQANPLAIQCLIVDDAPQFKAIVRWLGLCWIHEGRHYKKMNPIIPRHKEVLTLFRETFWDYYQQLLDYKAEPSSQLVSELEKEFDALFSKKTGYEKLDKQMALTLCKKKELLLVLRLPFIPLHNNTVELGARVQARNRDIHLHTMSSEGTKMKDTLATLGETARKLGVNIYNYFLDRISKQYEMKSLANTSEDLSPVVLN